MWTLLSVPALPVVFNELTGRKKWHRHNQFSAVLSLTALAIGLFIIISLAISWVVFLMI